MDFFNVLTMIGGLALFLYGMHALGDGLEKLSGGKLERILEKLTANPVVAVFLGAFVTMAIQSSSATTVMVVGFVNSGIMKLRQAVYIIMGANIGTTITSWILSLSGLESSNFFIKLLKPASFSPVLAIVGVVFILFVKSEKKKDIGLIFVGFAILMFGMETMSGAVKPLAEVDGFVNILTMFKNPIFGMLAGLALTAIIQSSSASVGILQALCTTGAITFGAAVPIIMGQNIGTCVTAMLSSIGASKNARRAALVHLYFNLIGTILFMVLFYTLHAFIGFGFMEDTASGVGIAIVHSTFNVAATLILLPFGRLLEKLAIATVKDKKETMVVEEDFRTLDIRFLDVPGIAVEQCKNLTVKMAELSKECLMKAVSLIDKYDENIAKEVIDIENKVDKYEDELGTYIIRITSRNLTSEDSKTLSVILHTIGDFERISDHAVNIMEAAKEMDSKKISFSENAREELGVFIKAVEDIVKNSIDVFENNDIEKAKDVEPLEEIIDSINDEMKKRHVERLLKNECTIELGFVFSDITTNLERVSDHCSNIAVSLIQLKENSFGTHGYLNAVKREDQQFKETYEKLISSYQLP